MLKQSAVVALTGIESQLADLIAQLDLSEEDQAKVNAPIGLKVRSSPDTISNNYLRTLPDKTIVSIYETNGTWGRIDSIKSEWCSLIYLSIIG